MTWMVPVVGAHAMAKPTGATVLAVTLTVSVAPPVAVQFRASPEIATVWLPTASPACRAVAFVPIASGEAPSRLTV